VDKANVACSDSSGTPYCTVQAAVTAAAAGDVVEVAAGSYIETITIDRNLTVTGAGISTVAGACAGQTELLGAPAVTVTAGATATLSGVTLKGTINQGGAVYNAGVLTLSKAEVCQSLAFIQGGGLYTTGALKLEDVQVYDNGPAAAGVEGGGVYVAAGGSAVITRGTFTGNQAARGGAIAVAAGGVLVLTQSVLELNIADVTVPTATPGEGGGIYNAGIALIDQTSVGGDGAGNVVIDPTGAGGGIYNAGGLLLTRSAIIENGVQGLGGIALGAGLYNAGVAAVISTTVSGNLFTSQLTGWGAGIASSGTLSLSNVTVTANVNTGAGAVGAGVYVVGGTATMRNSIVAAQGFGDDCSGAMVTDGYNLDSDGTCNLVSVAAGGTDQPAVNALLLPLADYGGPTRGHALSEASPAVDGGDPAGCLADVTGGGVPTVPLLADQRGSIFTDVVNAAAGACDSGALEFELVRNGMMEDDDTLDRLPDGWTGSGLLAGDKLFCEPSLAHAGRCFFRLVGRTAQVKQLSQRLVRSGKAGDLYTLRLFVGGLNVGGSPRARVQIDDLQVIGIQQEVVLALPTGTYDYAEQTLEIASTVNGSDRITIIVEAGNAGQLAIDDVSLVPHP
jgi:hypothetical protein